LQKISDWILTVTRQLSNENIKRLYIKLYIKILCYTIFYILWREKKYIYQVC